MNQWSLKADKDTIYNYFKSNGFEVRQGYAKDYNYTEDHKFELRIRHSDPQQIEALLEEIKQLVRSP